MELVFKGALTLVYRTLEQTHSGLRSQILYVAHNVEHRALEHRSYGFLLDFENSDHTPWQSLALWTES